MSCNIGGRTVWVYRFLRLPKTDADYHTRCPAETKLSKGKQQVESCQSAEWMASFYTPENILIRICFNGSYSFYFKCIAFNVSHLFYFQDISYYKNKTFSSKLVVDTCPELSWSLCCFTNKGIVLLLLPATKWRLKFLKKGHLYILKKRSKAN